MSDDAAEAVFAPVHTPTAFEETIDRLGTAINLGLLTPGSQLPPERELSAMLGIARSTLRQALTALTESGHLRAQRGRGGGTFVVDRPPTTQPPSPEELAQWRDVCDWRLSIEIGVAMLAAERATPDDIDSLADIVDTIERALDDFPAYRQNNVRFHISLAQATGSPRLITAMTEAQGAMSSLLAHSARPIEALAWANDQHRQLVSALRERDRDAAARVMTEHLHGTEHVLAYSFPAESESAA